MTPQPNEDRQRDLVPQIVAELGGAGIGALAGLAIGGPIGALVGAAATPAAAQVARLAQQAVLSRIRRAQSTVEGAADSANLDVTALEELILDDDQKLTVALEILEASANTPLPGKLRGLAQALATIARTSDSVELDRVVAVVRGLRTLDEIHFRVLRHIELQESTSSTPDDLETATGFPVFELRPVVRQLELVGFIADQSRLAATSNPIAWELTQTGAVCLKLVADQS